MFMTGQICIVSAHKLPIDRGKLVRVLARDQEDTSKFLVEDIDGKEYKLSYHVLAAAGQCGSIPWKVGDQVVVRTEYNGRYLLRDSVAYINSVHRDILNLKFVIPVERTHYSPRDSSTLDAISVYNFSVYPLDKRELPKPVVPEPWEPMFDRGYFFESNQGADAYLKYCLG